MPLSARAVEERPRVIQQFTAIFLVSQSGDVWRVYDSESPKGWGRRIPSKNPATRTRVFVGIGQPNGMRVYRFGAEEAREVSAQELQRQLDDSSQAT